LLSACAASGTQAPSSPQSLTPTTGRSGLDISEEAIQLVNIQQVQ
jgi:hypothetical protein